MTKETTIAYLAGLVDGEGYVGIKKSTYGMRKRKDVYCPTYHERIQIRMVDEEAISLFKKVFGGSYYRETENSKYSKRPLYCYQVSDKKAAETLKILLPHLRIKRRQAKICLKLRRNKESVLARRRGGPKGRRMPKKIVNYRNSLWKQIKQIHGNLN